MINKQIKKEIELAPKYGLFIEGGWLVSRNPGTKWNYIY